MKHKQSIIPWFFTFIIIIAVFISFKVKADEETKLDDLSDSIAILCDIHSTKPMETKETCITYYVNCAIKHNNTWSSKGLVECIEEKKNR